MKDRPFVCNGCRSNIPPITKDSIKKAVAGEVSLSTAAEKIKRFFSYRNDCFILYCKACIPGPTVGYILRGASPAERDNGFGTYVSLRLGGNHKGGDDFYKFSDLLRYLSDSLLVVDSLQLSTASMVNNDTAVYGSLKASYQLGGRVVERPVPYDRKRQVYTLSYAALFSDLPRTITDTLPVRLSYLLEGEKVDAPGEVKLFFASDAEKEDLKYLFAVYRQSFPDWTTDEITNELLAKVCAKYKRASRDNIYEWLRNLPSAK